MVSLMVIPCKGPFDQPPHLTGSPTHPPTPPPNPPGFSRTLWNTFKGLMHRCTANRCTLFPSPSHLLSLEAPVTATFLPRAQAKQTMREANGSPVRNSSRYFPVDEHGSQKRGSSRGDVCENRCFVGFHVNLQECKPGFLTCMIAPGLWLASTGEVVLVCVCV